MYYTIKILISALLILCISEVSKRNVTLGSLMAAIPLVSVVTMFWIYFESKDIQKIMELSSSIFWLVIPSLLLFISLPYFLKLGWNFYTSMTIAIFITATSYVFMIKALEYLK